MVNEYSLRNPGRREAGIAVLVACLLLSVAWLSGRGAPIPGGRVSDGQLASSTSASGSVVNIDTSSSVSQAQIQSCLSPSFAHSASDVTVLYAAQQRASTGTVPVMVLRNSAGALRLCDSFGGTAVATAPTQLASASAPVAFLSNSRQAWDCDATRIAGYEMSQWLSVAPSVATVQVRFAVDNVAGPWFSTAARNGLAHPHAWLSEQNVGAKVTTQTRVLNASGHTVSQKTLPTGVRPLSGCHGGNVQLG